MDATFFESPAELRRWFEQHHDQVAELLIGFYKKSSGRPSVTYAEALDEALCFGWIDGVRRALDADSYTIRFTPRQPHSIWSAVNLKHVERLTTEGSMQPSGLKAFRERDPDKQGLYSFERDQVQLDPAYEAQFRADAQAWTFFQSRPPSYRKPAIWWVMSAKQEATRLRRLATLIADSAAGRKIAPLTRKSERE